MVTLLLAPLAQAQEVSYIGCAVNGGPGVDCTETPYGLGNAGFEQPLAEGSIEFLYVGPGDGSCGPFSFLPTAGQMVLRELDACEISASNRCMVEIPQRPAESGIWLRIANFVFDQGPLGLIAFSGHTLEDMGIADNIGHRELRGSCTDDAGEACALDSDCPSGTGCLSTCFDDPGTTCASHQDCVDAGLPGNNCITKIEWDGIGTCTDDATFCTSDADCPGEELCEGGIDWEKSEGSCVCCLSTSGTLCASQVSLIEGVNCPEPAVPEFASVNAPDWVFEGGAGTKFELEDGIIIPGQQEGRCGANENRPCGFRGDFWAGAANGKCTNPGSCADPFNPANPALASTCDDVAFGGVAGDFCNLVEPGIREENLIKNPDGTQDITQCAQAGFSLVGTPNTMCSINDPLPEGDPQPGCILPNMGFATRPDYDCNGIDDTLEGRCMPVGGALCSEPGLCPPCANDGECASGICINNGDLCTWMGENNQHLDSNNDGIGDQCQCGDQNGDGAITSTDIGGTALCANGALPAPQCAAVLVDATGDNATTAEDVAGIVAVVNGAITTADLLCASNIDTSSP